VTKYDAVVIGAGFAGLSVGALLANAGKRVVVIEKSKSLGGRSSITNCNGEIIGNGIHTLIPEGSFEEIFKRTGKAFPKYVGYNRTKIFHHGKLRDTRATGMDSAAHAALACFNKIVR
jgi:phytoene dehydrogenase-like protein